MMKRYLTVGIALTAAAVTLAACGKADDKNAGSSAAPTSAAETVYETKSAKELTDEAKITLGQYKGLELTRTKTSVSDEQLQSELDYILDANPERSAITGRAAASGDTANLDYVGTKDGVAFEGGSASGFDLELGSGKFIDGFEDGVIGMGIGEEKDLTLTFPDPYPNNPDLAGKPVVFHVKLNSLAAVSAPELDDAFAKRYLEDESATVDILKSKVHGDLERMGERDSFYETANDALTRVIGASEIVCDPDAVDQMNRQLQQTYGYYAGAYGMELDSYLSMMLGTDRAGLEAMAEELVRQQMVLDEIARVEKIQATDEQKKSLAEESGYADVSAFVAAYGEESANNLFTMEATYHFLIDNAVVTEKEAESAAAGG